MRAALVGRREELHAALAALRGDGGVALIGTAGIGKSRIFDEALCQLPQDAWAIHRIVASAAAQEIAFGAMFPEVRPDGPQALPYVLSDLRRSLLEAARGRRSVLAVDDAHLLDPWTLTLLNDLVRRGEAQALLTVRAEAVAPPTLTALWTSGVIDRIDVPALTEVDSAELGATVLGDRLSGALAGQAHEICRGNPLLLREVLLDSRASGALGHTDDGWVGVEPLRPGPRVVDLVSARLSSLGSDARSVLDLVAVGEPVTVGILGEDERRQLDELEVAGLVHVDLSETGHRARCDHALIGDAIRRALPTRRRDDVRRDVIRRMTTHRPLGPGDALRAARWAGELHDPVDPVMATVAAAEALAVGEYELAAAFAGEVLETEDSLEALLSLAQARRMQSRPDEAISALERASFVARSDADRARCARLQAQVLSQQLARPSEAVTVLRALAARVVDRGIAAQLETQASAFAGLLGGHSQVIEDMRSMLDAAGTDGDLRLEAISNLAFAQVMTGRIQHVEDHLTEALRIEKERVDHDAAFVDLLWALRVGVAIQRGELHEGAQLGRARIQEARESGEPFTATGTILLQLLLTAGAADLLPLADELIARLDEADGFGMMPMARAMTAAAHVERGDVEEARRQLAEIPDELDDERVLPFVATAEAGLLRAEGRLDEAANAVVAAARRSVETTHTVFGLVTLHSAVAWCDDVAVISELASSAVVGVEGALLRAMAHHVEAWRSRDASLLDDVGRRFASFGARPAATCAFSQAALVSVGLDRCRRHARASLWARSIEPFQVEQHSIDGGLSDRELDVVALAVLGRSSRSIAGDLFLSVRTVDNHLRSAYRKLGVGGRAEILDVLSPLPGVE